MPKYSLRSKKSQRRRNLNVKRSSIIDSTDKLKSYDVPAKDLGLVIPAYQGYLYSKEQKMVNFSESELFRGLSFRKKSWVPRTIPLEKDKEYGDTYNVNLPDQQYEFVPPDSANEMSFNPLKMYLTAQANYEVAARGGNLPISLYTKPQNRRMVESNRSRTLPDTNYVYSGVGRRVRA